MATFQTNFSEYSVGVQPFDWTPIWVTANSTWNVQSLTGALGGQVLEHTATADARRAITWDSVGTVTGDFDILCKWRTSDSASGNIPIRIFTFVSGSSTQSTQNGYQLDGLFPSTLRIGRTQNGSYSTLASNTAIPSMSPNTWYWYRFRKVGSTLEARIWPDGSAEPSLWDVSVTSTLFNSGPVGLGAYDFNGVREIDYFAVGTLGDVAPSPTVAPVDTTPPSEITNLTEKHTDIAVIFDWIEPTDADFKTVEVYKDGVHYAGDLNFQTFTDTNVLPSTSYLYRFTTVDDLGNESNGVEISVTTDSAKTYEHLKPNAVTYISNFEPSDVVTALTYIDDDPDSEDTLVLTPPVSPTGAPTVRVKFDPPSSPVKGLQTIKWAFDDPSFYGTNCIIYENGVEILRSSSPHYAINGVEPVVFIFDSSILVDKTLANVEVEIQAVIIGTSTIDNFGAIKWSHALDVYLDGSIVGSSTVSGDLTIITDTTPQPIAHVLDGSIDATTSISGDLTIISTPSSGGGTPVEWINGQNVSISADGTITKISGGSAWNAGARSSTSQVTNGEDFSVQTTVDSLKDIAIGFSEQTDSNYSNTDLDYNFTLNSNGTYGVYCLGYQETSGNYSIGDTFKVAYENGNVSFYQNDVQVHRNTYVVYLPLLIDSSIYTQGHSIPNVGINGAVSSGPIQHALSGSITVNSAVSGNLNKTTLLSGSLEVVSSVAGAVSQVIPFNGNSSAYSSIQNDGILIEKSISGSLTSLSELNGIAAFNRGLSGIVQPSSNVEGNILKHIGLNGSIEGNSNVTGILYKKIQFNGNIQADSIIEGVFADTSGLFGSIQADSQVQSSLGIERSISGSVITVSSLEGVTGINRGMNGLILSDSSLEGSIGVQRGIEGSIQNESSLSSLLEKSIEFNGSIENNSSLLSMLNKGISLNGASSEISIIDGEISKRVSFNGVIQNYAYLESNLVKGLSLESHIESDSLLQSILEKEVMLQGEIQEKATLQSTFAIDGHIPLNGNVAGASELFGTVQRSRLIEGMIVAESSLSSDITVEGEVLLSGEIVALSLATADITVEGEILLNGIIGAESSLFGDLINTVPLEALISIETQISGIIVIDGSISLKGQVNNDSSLTSDLLLSRSLFGQVMEEGEIRGSLLIFGEIHFIGSIEAESVLSGKINFSHFLIGEIIVNSSIIVQEPLNKLIEVDNEDYTGVSFDNDEKLISYTLDSGIGRKIEFLFEFQVNPINLQKLEFRIEGTNGQPFTLRPYNYVLNQWDEIKMISFDGVGNPVLSLFIDDLDSYISPENKVKIQMKSTYSFMGVPLTLSSDYAELRKTYIQYQ